MLRRKPREYKKAINLRKKGESYRKIARTVGVSKGTVSLWCKDLKLPLRAKEIIEEKIKHNKKFLIFYSKEKHKRVQAENKKIRRESSGQISNLSERELLLVGTALYWGEGYKRQEHIPSPSVSFVNSDPGMIVLFLRFLREIIQIPEERIAPTIRIHPNISAKTAITFWSKITNISKDRFRVGNQISKSSRRRRPKNTLPYGTLDLRFCSRQNFYKIMGWIDGLIQQNIKTN